MAKRPASLPFSRLSLSEEEYIRIALGELVYWRATTLIYAMMCAFCALVTGFLVWQLCRNTERAVHLPLICLTVMAAFCGGLLRAFLSRPERKRLLEMLVRNHERAEALQGDLQAMRARAAGADSSSGGPGDESSDRQA